MNNAIKVPSHDAPHPHEPIRTQLRQRLLALNYHAFAQCLCLLLSRIGYEDVAVAGRTRWKGRNREGGHDMEAWLPAGIGRRRVIVQAKQFDALPIFQRSVDELRGTCLRARAVEALLITTSTFSSVVRQNVAHIGPQVAPVRLLDGEELINLLLRHRIGVREEAGESPNAAGGFAGSVPCPLGIDEAFFEGLSRDFPGTGRRPTPLHRLEHKDKLEHMSRLEHQSRSEHEKGDTGRGERACWLVTVRVGSPGLLGTGRRARERGNE